MQQRERMAETKTVLKPPLKVKGMTTLDRSLFDDTLQVKALMVKTHKLPKVLKILKNHRLKLRNVKPVIELDQLHLNSKSHRLVLLDPSCLQIWDDLPNEMQQSLQEADVSHETLEDYSIQVTYENWKFQDIMAAVLPEEVDGVSGFSEVGHIAHFNLRDKSLPYKHLIGIYMYLTIVYSLLHVSSCKVNWLKCGCFSLLLIMI